MLWVESNQKMVGEGRKERGFQGRAQNLGFATHSSAMACPCFLRTTWTPSLVSAMMALKAFCSLVSSPSWLPWLSPP